MSKSLQMLSKNVSRLRKAKGWTQEQLADSMGVSWQTIARIETKRQWPSSETFDRLVEAFEVEPMELFATEGFDLKGQTLESSLAVALDHLGFELRRKKK
jgi:transcriptional regulator with XRE-family HTH domain